VGIPRTFSAALLVLASAAFAQEGPFLTLASTTSTNDSGLFTAILPRFEAETGIEVRVVAVGTGQALELGRRGDADALLVHDRASEDAFLAEGFALFRRDVMYNDFVLVGPAADPAGVGGGSDAARAFARIAGREAAFVSRGDDSGTHKAELRLWQAAGVDPRLASGRWYREVGGGMGATLNVANELPGYTLADRATWLAYQRRESLRVVVEGDPVLRNPYGVLVVDPARHPHTKVELATRFADWLTGPAGRGVIEGFRIGGEAPFFLLPPTETRRPLTPPRP
jgi:tungstate transport system substrate-binding protein